MGGINVEHRVQPVITPRTNNALSSYKNGYKVGPCGSSVGAGADIVIRNLMEFDE